MVHDVDMVERTFNTRPILSGIKLTNDRTITITDVDEFNSSIVTFIFDIKL